ncbi:ArsR/SmtB family transcription factor [Nocardia flavorosea]|uniref:Helix-turn-helix transcriptional regulator n=1 Tax=Nocardia flavorosea TaxID=53429 RepID=A0A846YQM1_9NOCA|nr:helix-turn-helix transcriptional regulator [Nocardia flavorosea]NKY59668.1 helix-turn-helix transcriptional regulator [Nocardia flavorosea]
MTDTLSATYSVAPLPTVLGALQDPVRLEMIRRLSNAGTALRCASLYDGINKSTATHHFKILREAGITERLVVDGNTYQQLRTEALDAALPGLLAAVVDAANHARPE